MPATCATTERRVRTAKKHWRCVNAYAHKAGNLAVATCTVVIAPGEQYTEGDMDPYCAGGFGFDKICMPCAKGGQA